MTRTKVAAIVALAVLGLSGVALAADVTASGTCMHSPPIVSESVELPDGRTVQRVVNRGICVGDDAENPFDRTSQYCTGSQIVGTDGTVVSVGNICESVDADGDVAWRWDEGTPTAGRWGSFGGSGKFEDLGGGGTWELETALPDGSAVYRWQGTVKMK